MNTRLAEELAAVLDGAYDGISTAVDPRASDACLINLALDAMKAVRDLRDEILRRAADGEIV